MITLEIGKIKLTVPQILKETFILNFQNNFNLLKKNYPLLAKQVEEEENDIKEFSLLKQNNNIFISFTLENNLLSLLVEEKENIVLTEVESKYLLNKRVVISSLIPFNLLFKMAKTKNLEELSSEKHSFKFKVPIYVIEKYLDIFRVFLCLYDLREIFNGNKLFIFFLGKNSLQDFKNHLLDEQIELPNLTLSLPEMNYSQETAEKINNILSKVWEKKEEDFKNIFADIDSYYNQINLSDWAEIYKSKKNLNILILTTCHSTFIKYSSRDLQDGFKTISHNAFINLEKDIFSKLTPLSFVKDIQKHKPDLIISINKLRSEYPFIPTNIPFVTWVQDNLPSLIDPKNVRKIDKLNLIINADSFTNFGYPKENIYNVSSIVTNTKIYNSLNLSLEDYEKYSSDISFISNHSETSYEIFNFLKEDICNKIASSFSAEKEIFIKFLDSFYEVVNKKYSSGEIIYAPYQYEEIIRKLLKEFKVEINKSLKANIINGFYDKVGANFLRHKVLNWLKEENINFKLYGKGWENNKKFAKYASGVIENGKELCKAFKATKVNLHIDYAPFHWRVYDGFASGGFFLFNYSFYADYNPEQYLLLRNVLQSLNKKTTVNEICEKVKDKILVYKIRQICYSFFSKINNDVIELEEIKQFLTPQDTFTRDMNTSYINFVEFISYKNLPNIYYKNKKEFIEKIKYYLKNEEERKTIAKKTNEFIQNYSYNKFCDNLLNTTAYHLEKLIVDKTK